MTRLQRSSPLRWLCTVAAVVALVIILFPVYAIIVGSFESTETLFSGTFYWLPHAATLDNYRTVLEGASGSTQATVGGPVGPHRDQSYRRPGHGTAGPGRSRAGGVCALEDTACG